MINQIQSKAAFAALVGRPSAGKSSLVNLFCGEKVSIVSAVPQTTRNAIRGIINRAAGQIVLVDTPGRHASERKLNKKLLDVSSRSITDADLILYVLDASRAPGPEELAIASVLKPHSAACIVAVNKMDLPSANFAVCRAFLAQQLPEVPDSRIFTVSALKDENAEALIEALFSLAPAGSPFYPPEYYTDQELPFRVSEIIREKAINKLRDELPHALYVEVADAELRETPNDDKPQKDQRPLLWVRAFIIMERESQKGMVVGKGGAMIKAIRQEAQKEISRIFGWKVELDLRVKSSSDWRHNDYKLKRICGGT
ncbi:GTPase Era [Spirochaetia bacterium]|nr:GTPase Era [Spirochaetia bacterium]